MNNSTKQVFQSKEIMLSWFNFSNKQYVLWLSNNSPSGTKHKIEEQLKCAEENLHRIGSMYQMNLFPNTRYVEDDA